MKCECLTCKFCGNAYSPDYSWQHENCEEFYHFMLDEMITKLKHKLDCCWRIKAIIGKR